MRKFLYIIFLLILGNQVLAQRKFKSSQWEEWDQAALQLQMGNFDRAMSIYRLYPSDPGFSSRLEKTQFLKNLYSEGLKLQRERKYPEAIAMYKKHRNDFYGMGSLSVFERKIDECIQLSGSPDNSKLKDLERRNLAAEYSYKALKKLLIMDTQGAMKDYDLAKRFGSKSSPLRKKYEDDFNMIQEVIQWQQLTKQIVGKDLEQEKVAFSNYRAIKGVPVLPSIETKIQVIIAQIEGKNVLLNFAQNCETQSLLSYVQEHKLEFKQSETLLSKLMQYSSIRNKIDILSISLDDSATVKSAFSSIETMTRSFNELPVEVKKSLETCLKNDKHRIFMGYSAMAARDSNYFVAQSFLNEAKELSLPEKEAEINSWESGLNAQKSLSEEIKRKSENVRRNDYKINREFNHLKSLIEKGYCKEAKINILSIKKSYSLNIKQAEELTKIETAIKTCQAIKLNIGLIAGVSANKPLYKINTYYQNMSYGITSDAGIALSVRNYKSSFNFLARLEYFNTNYNSLNTDNLAIENFKISGASGSVNIGFIPVKFSNGSIFISIGAEGIIPMSYKYTNYSADTKIMDRAQLISIIISGQAGVGMEFRRFFIEGFANYGLSSIYNKSAINVSTTSNKQVDARFRRAGIRIGIWVL